MLSAVATRSHKARRLDRYLVKKFYKAARHHHAEVTAKEDLIRYSDVVGK